MDGHDGEEDDEDAVAALFMEGLGGEFGEADDEAFVASQDGVLPLTSSMGASSRAESPPQGQPALLAQMLGGDGPPTPTRGPAITLLGSTAPTEMTRLAALWSPASSCAASSSRLPRAA